MAKGSRSSKPHAARPAASLRRKAGAAARAAAKAHAGVKVARRPAAGKPAPGKAAPSKSHAAAKPAARAGRAGAPHKPAAGRPAGAQPGAARPVAAPTGQPGAPGVQWRKAPPEMIALFEELLGGVPQSEPRKMFGYPAAFRRGNMFAGLFQEQLVLRLAEGDRVTIFAAKRATPFMPMPGRAMREYVSFSKPMQTTREELLRWLQRSFAYADSMPAKPGKR